jgi:hypothetical protein
MIAPNTMLRLECIVVNVLDVEKAEEDAREIQTLDLRPFGVSGDLTEVRSPRSDAALYYHAKR